MVEALNKPWTLNQGTTHQPKLFLGFVGQSREEGVKDVKMKMKREKKIRKDEELTNKGRECSILRSGMTAQC